MEFSLLVTKVHAYGRNIKVMYVSMPFYHGYVRISDELYRNLREIGVPSALRKK